MNKDLINKNEELKKILDDLLKKDQSNKLIIEQVELIKKEIIENEIEILNINKYIPFKKRFINNFIKSKTVFINLILLILTILEQFTDILKNSENEYLKILSILIPILTIYFRTFEK